MRCQNCKNDKFFIGPFVITCTNCGDIFEYAKADGTRIKDLETAISEAQGLYVECKTKLDRYETALQQIKVQSLPQCSVATTIIYKIAISALDDK